MPEAVAIAPLKPGEPGKRPKAGRLELAFRRAPSGQTFVDRQFSSYPFHVCRALYLDDDAPGMATVYTQSSSGGLYTQDHLTASMHAGPDTQVHLTTQASTIVHRAARGAAEQDVYIEADERTYVEYLPDPVILLPGARLASKLRVRVSGSSSVILFDAFLAHDPERMGRHFDEMHSEVVIEDEAGRQLVVDRFRVGGQDLASPVRGVTGGYGCQGTIMAFSPRHDPAGLLEASRKAAADCGEVAVGLSLLPGDCGVWGRVMAMDGADLKQAMVRVWSSLRKQLTGHAPDVRRK